GKIAGYLKANIQNKYKITSSLDTTRTRYRYLFRYIDPDKYYPLYGDESTVSWEATNTQGPLYLKVETTPKSGLGTSSFLWGNYSTGINENELATYNRTLYGAKLGINVEGADSKLSALRSTLFAAETYQLAGHNEFRATGGSFYYLKHKDIIEGSEQIRVEVRDKITHLPLGSSIKERDKDYQIDYDTGRIIFNAPVGSIVTSDSIISSNIQGGNPVYVIIDYEYQPDRLHFHRGAYGGRAAYTPLKPVTVGVTYVSEEDNDKDYVLKGADATLKLPLMTTLKGEYAETESRALPGFISLNGGFTFNEVSAGNLAEGSAYRVSTRTKAAKKTEFDTYFQRIQPGFSTAGSITNQATEKYGVAVAHELITDRLSLTARHDAQELLRNSNNVSSALIGGRKTEVSSLQGVCNLDKLTLTGEYRYQKVKNDLLNITSETNTNTAFGALKADYALTSKTSVFLGQQNNFKGPANHQTTGGISTEIKEGLRGTLQGTSGTNGESAQLGLNSQVSAATEVYTNLGYQATRDHERQRSIATGTSSQVNSQTRVYAQNEYRRSSSARANASVVGQESELARNWKIGCQLERGLINNFDGTETIRKAGSVNLGYNDKKKLDFFIKLETRYDQGDYDSRQYVTSNRARYKLTQDLTLLGRLNWSRTENDLTDTTDALFKEGTLGVALRPVNWDKLNLLAKYTYLNDKKPVGQIGTVDEMAITSHRAHVYALEVAYDINKYFQIVEKYAFKNGQEKVGSRDYTDSDTDLWINRLNYHLTNKWDAGLEYRILRQKLADDQKAGYLCEVLYKVSKLFQLGAGYNFTDFTDNLIDDNDYSARGPFIRLVATIIK
ncbi:MAG: hypothetical protein KAI63_04545, partial [Planctomycetes bacterium]|nr:hypothetical protein [Planctomycetota bacterium]